MMDLKNKQQGMALVESLVAILVLAIGVLGLLGVQLRTLSENRTATSRLIAARLAEDFFERLKSNADSWTQLATYADANDGTRWNIPTAATDCAAAVCTPAQRAVWDRRQWKLAVQNALPVGQATAFVSPTDPRQLGVMVAWRVNESSADTNYLNPFNVNVSDSGTVVTCPANAICHIAYAQP